MNTKYVPPAQAQAQHLASDRFPFTAEALENAAAAMAESLHGGYWQSYTDDRKNVWRARAHLAASGGWRSMGSAPFADPSACIDIWCAQDECRYIDCYWDHPSSPFAKRATEACWVREVYEANYGFYAVAVAKPVAWMPAPAKPEGV